MGFPHDPTKSCASRGYRVVTGASALPAGSVWSDGRGGRGGKGALMGAILK